MDKPVTKRFYFTFGFGSPLQNYTQVIVARNLTDATKLMFKTWGTNWMVGYSEKEFAKERESGVFRNLKPLKTLYADKLITVAETEELTKRFESILSGAKKFRLSRLEKLYDDIITAFDIFNDDVARTMCRNIVIEIFFAEMKAS